MTQPEPCQPVDAAGGGLTVEVVERALSAHGYLADEGLATSIFLALKLGRPLFLEGEAGVGKTEVAKVLAAWRKVPLLRLQCYEGIDASQAIYDWDYARQLMHLRAAESGEAVEDELYGERFLIPRPLLSAVNYSGPTPVLLIDEVDRADDEFEALLLEFLSDYSVSIPEVGTFKPEIPPLVVITSNRTRDVHDALKRRCLYHWVEHPDFDQEVAIISMRVPYATKALARQVAAVVESMRGMHLYKPPGVAESIDWTASLAALGRQVLDERGCELTLGSVLKYHEDQARVRSAGIAELIRAAVERSSE